ncbi:MAG: hypothetical protein HY319_06310 [Armatimonadetes bacterium]|nr:hypothetical protein [Armatimonadota bacterium]
MLKSLTSVFQKFQEWSSKDEIIFGEIVRLMVERGYPLIGFEAGEDRQCGRFLLDQDVLYAVRIVLDKKIGSVSVLNLTAEVRNKLADPDDMISMFKTDLMNIAKIPLLGQIKLNHEYNTIYATVSAFKSLNTYTGSRVGEVNTDLLRQDLDEILNRLTEELRRFKKK